jgi:hypothetical protein
MKTRDIKYHKNLDDSKKWVVCIYRLGVSLSDKFL